MNMSAIVQHTAEPWGVSSSCPRIIVQFDALGESGVIIGSASGYTGSGYFPSDDEAKINARRIVACVNACAGIPVEALEACAAGNLPFSVPAQIQARIQRKSLLAAAKDTLIRYGTLDKGWQALRAAIAKCELQP